MGSRRVCGVFSGEPVNRNSEGGHRDSTIAAGYHQKNKRSILARPDLMIDEKIYHTSKCPHNLFSIFTTLGVQHFQIPVQNVSATLPSPTAT